jgi:hypothetical protein
MNITFSVDSPDLEKCLQDIKKWKNRKINEIRWQVRRSTINIQGEARKNAPRGATSFLAGSINTRFTMDGLSAEVYCNAMYARWVEFGRRPGKPPPFSAIYPWVIVKVTKNVKEAKKIAYAVMWKIAHQGTKKQPFLFPAAERERRRFIDGIRRILQTR